jgi:hypothetical protein
MRDMDTRALDVERIRIGTNPRTRLEWLLDRVVYAEDLEGAEHDATREARLEALVLFLVDPATSRDRAFFRSGALAAKSEQAFARLVQRPLRRLLEELTSTTPDTTVRFSGRTTETWLVLVRFGNRWGFTEWVVGDFRQTLTTALMRAVAQVPPSQLRACRWEGCGRVFVARKRQRACAAHRREVRLKQYRDAQRARRKRLKEEAEKRSKRKNRRQER